MRGHHFATSTMRKIPLLMGLLAALFVHAPAFAAGPSVPDSVVGTSIGSDLTIDTSFGEAGYTVVNYNDDGGTWDEAVRVIAADDGGFWLIGFHRTNADADRLAVSRLDANGVIDTSYGVDGKIVVPTGVNLIRDAVLANGRFYVAGIHFIDSSLGIFGVACVELDGTLCDGFGDGGTVTIAINEPGFNSEADRILYRDGALYAIGDTDPGGSSGHSSAMALAKLDAATGALDANFGDGSGPLPGTEILDPNLHVDGMDFAYAAAFAANGNVLVGGQAQGSGELGSEAYVLSIDPASGTLDPAFGSGGYVYFSYDTGVHFDDVSVHAIRVQDDGRIVLAGNANHDDEFFNTLTNVFLASLEPDGTPTPGFGVDGTSSINVGVNTTVLDMVVRSNGDLVVGMASNGLVPNDYTSDGLQSFAQFDASGNGPTSTTSIEFPSMVTPGGQPASLLVDAQDRVLAAGFRLWDFNFPIPDSDHSMLRLVRDNIFAGGFELPPGQR
jgi:uncharacterized delta-60 repeat protein